MAAGDTRGFSPPAPQLAPGSSVSGGGSVGQPSLRAREREVAGFWGVGMAWVGDHVWGVSG